MAKIIKFPDRPRNRKGPPGSELVSLANLIDVAVLRVDAVLAIPKLRKKLGELAPRQEFNIIESRRSVRNYSDAELYAGIAKAAKPGVELKEPVQYYYALLDEAEARIGRRIR